MQPSKSWISFPPDDVTVISVLFSAVGVWLPLLRRTNIGPGRTKEVRKLLLRWRRETNQNWVRIPTSFWNIPPRFPSPPNKVSAETLFPVTPPDRL